MKFFIVFALILAGSLVEGRPGVFDGLFPRINFSTTSGGGARTAGRGERLSHIEAFPSSKHSGLANVAGDAIDRGHIMAHNLTDGFGSIIISAKPTFMPVRDQTGGTKTRLTLGGGITGDGASSAGSNDLELIPGMRGISADSTGLTGAIPERVNAQLNGLMQFAKNRVKCAHILAAAMCEVVNNLCHDLQSLGNSVVSGADINKLIDSSIIEVRDNTKENPAVGVEVIRRLNNLRDELQKQQQGTLTKAQFREITAKSISESLPAGTELDINSLGDFGVSVTADSSIIRTGGIGTEDVATGASGTGTGAGVGTGEFGGIFQPEIEV